MRQRRFVMEERKKGCAGRSDGPGTRKRDGSNITHKARYNGCGSFKWTCPVIFVQSGMGSTLSYRIEWNRLMKRLFPSISIGLNALSLCLCLAVVSLWIASFWVLKPIPVYFGRREGQGDVLFARGHVILDNDRQYRLTLKAEHLVCDASEVRYLAKYRAYVTAHPTAGVAEMDLVNDELSKDRISTVDPPPPWRWESGKLLPGAAMTLAIAPILAFRSFTKRRREKKEGCCVVCGYDLRATPKRCPECGTPTPRGIASGE